jgi:FtsH-binding integral membrane protein
MNDYSETINNSAANAAPMDRASFIRKTYVHLSVCLLAFILLEGFIFASGAAYSMASLMLMGGSMGWLVVLGLFIGATFLATQWANSETSKTTQYAGLALYIVAEAVIFVPLLFLISRYSGPDVIVKAGIISLGLFLGITSVVFLTKTDFSFLGPIIVIGFCVTLGLILVSLIFGFNLGTFFAFAMVALAGTSILYQTSNVMNKYRTDQYVAASLGLFASILFLFWYILQIFSGRR